MSDLSKTPRIYTDRTFAPGASISLETAQTHYVKNVLRMKQGEFIRLFNGREGEWLASLTEHGKSSTTVTLKGKTREQPVKIPEIHLLFAPIKKDRMDFLIEKAVELGATHLHPVITNRTEVRKINEERIRAQIIEATEQCERLDIPTLAQVEDLKRKITSWPAATPLLWCRERSKEAPALSTLNTPAWAFLIGPEGGFDDSENAFLSTQPPVKPVSLGETILRAETAALLALGYAKMTPL